jgi:hypothetical protein
VPSLRDVIFSWYRHTTLLSLVPTMVSC